MTEHGRRHWLELRVPPPLVALAFGALVWMLAPLFPVALALPFDTLWLALMVAFVGICCDLSALFVFYRARTTVNPMSLDGTRVLVRGGIYHFSRNPMYLGLACLLCGWILYLGQWLLLVLMWGFVGYINRFQILPEERVLSARFGEDWDRWCSQVPRWIGWRR